MSQAPDYKLSKFRRLGASQEPQFSLILVKSLLPLYKYSEYNFRWHNDGCMYRSYFKDMYFGNYLRLS